MKQIRQSVFETNSSSMHSIVITNHDHVLTKDEYENESWNGVTRWDQLCLTNNHKLHLREEELTFDGGPQILCTVQEKCAFAIASKAVWDWEMTDFLDELTDIVKEICPEFAGFEFDSDTWEDNGETYTSMKYGGIDHQSYGLLQDMLIQEEIELRDFILNTRYYVIIDWEDDDVFRKLMNFRIADKYSVVRRYTGGNGDARRRNYINGEEQEDEEDSDSFY